MLRQGVANDRVEIGAAITGIAAVTRATPWAFRALGLPSPLQSNLSGELICLSERTSFVGFDYFGHKVAPVLENIGPHGVAEAGNMILQLRFLKLRDAAV